MGNNSKKVDESKMFKEVMTQFVLEDDPLLSKMKWMYGAVDEDRIGK